MIGALNLFILDELLTENSYECHTLQCVQPTWHFDSILDWFFFCNFCLLEFIQGTRLFDTFDRFDCTTFTFYFTWCFDWVTLARLGEVPFEKEWQRVTIGYINLALLMHNKENQCTVTTYFFLLINDERSTVCFWVSKRACIRVTQNLSVCIQYL